MGLKRWLEHPLTRGLDLDDPRTTYLRRQILATKPFLRRIYEEWYAAIARSLPSARAASWSSAPEPASSPTSSPASSARSSSTPPGSTAVLDGLASPSRRPRCAASR